MNVTDEERREVAQRLRENLNRSRLRYDTGFVHEIAEAVGWERLEDGITETLADLIDRPQCHPVTVPFGPCGDVSIGCSVCGEPLALNPFGSKGNKFYRRCINCGAEVVE